MNDDSVPRHRPDVLVDSLDDELLLYHPAAEKAVYLNETAFLVWRLCDGRRSRATIIGLLADAFPEAAPSIAQEVTTTLQRLADHGVIDFD